MLSPVEIIKNKRDGKVLSPSEIEFFVEGIQSGSIPDYQISAFAMAIYFQGMAKEELFLFTKAMIGETSQSPLVEKQGRRVDKHSTGGVGDKLSLILGPIVAAAGLIVPKMSGRGLGFSGGTIDKLESIPGFNTAIDSLSFQKQVNEIGLGIIGQSKDLAGADKKLYGLRDVTATVESIPLIASSIVSKKIASGNKNILFDVKVGQGAFMKTLEEGIKLGETLVELVKGFGGRSLAVISNMNAPLGHYVGNSLEVIEALEVLKGRGSGDLLQLSLELSGLMLTLGYPELSQEEALTRGKNLLQDGSALKKFKDMVLYQGGNLAALEDYTLFPTATRQIDIHCPEEGYIQSIDGEIIGKISVQLGAGRMHKEDSIDLGAGIHIPHSVGDWVNSGDLLASLYTLSNIHEEEELNTQVLKAFSIGKQQGAKEPLIYCVVS